MQEKLEKSQGEVYRLKAKLENAQGEQESLKQEMERGQAGIQRIVSERDKVISFFFKMISSLTHLSGYCVISCCASISVTIEIV